MSDDDDRVTISEAARRTGLNKGTVSRQVRDLDVPVGEDGLFSLSAYIAARQEGLNPATARAVDVGEPSDATSISAASRDAHQRRRTARPMSGAGRRSALQAELLELELDEKRGRILRRDDVVEVFATAARMTRDAVLSIPRRAAADIAAISDPAEIERLLDRMFKDALMGLSETISKLAGDAAGKS